MAIIDLQFEGDDEETPVADPGQQTAAPDNPQIQLEFEGERPGEEPLPAGVSGYAEPVEQNIFEKIGDWYNQGYSAAKLNIAQQKGLAFDETPEDVARTGARVKELGRQEEKYALDPTGDTVKQLHEISTADSITEAVGLMIKYPEATASVTISSLGRFAPALAATTGVGAATGGTALPLMATTFMGSLATEYGAVMDEEIRASGYDSADPMAWQNAVSDTEMLDRAKERGLKRGIPIAVFDALSMGIAGKLLAGAKPTATSILSRSTGELGVQIGSGMAGEASAQYVDTGEVGAPGEVAMEGFAEMGPGIVETMIGYKGAKEQALRKQMAEQAGADAAQQVADAALTPDFEVKPIEENVTAIDEALAAAPPTPETRPDEEGITDKFDLTPPELEQPQTPMNLEQQQAEDEANTYVLEQLRAQFPDATEEELQAAIGVAKPETKDLPDPTEGMKPVKPMAELPEAPPETQAAAERMVEELGKEPTAPEAEVAPEPVVEAEPDTTPVVEPETAVEPTQRLVPSAVEGGSFTYEGDKFQASVGNKAWSEFAYDATISTKDSTTTTGFRVRKDISKGFDTLQEARDYAEKIIAKDTPVEPSPEQTDLEAGATESVEPTGEASTTAESYSARRPEFEGLILSYKPGDDRNGETTTHYYGEIAETVDADGDPIDVVLNKDYEGEPWLAPVFIVNQNDFDTGEFRQHKVMAGFPTAEAAEKGYGEMWDAAGFGSVHELTPEQFTEWKAGDTTVPYSETTPGELAPAPDEKVSPVDTPLTAEEQKAQDKADRNEQQRVKMTEKAKEARQVNETDDLATFTRKLGGLNVETQSDIPAGRLKHLDKEGTVFGLPSIEQKGDKGVSLAQLTEAAWEAGYITENDTQQLIEKLFDAEQNKVYTTKGYEAVAELEADALYNEQLAAEAESWAEYARAELPQVDPETARLMALAGAIDHDAMVDLASKDAPEADVQALLQEFIDERKSPEVEAAPAEEPAIEAVQPDEGVTQTAEEGPTTPEEWLSAIENRIFERNKKKKVYQGWRDALDASEELHPTYYEDYRDPQLVERGFMAGYMYGIDQGRTTSASPQVGVDLADKIGLTEAGRWAPYFSDAHYLGQLAAMGGEAMPSTTTNTFAKDRKIGKKEWEAQNLTDDQKRELHPTMTFRVGDRVDIVMGHSEGKSGTVIELITLESHPNLKDPRKPKGEQDYHYAVKLDGEKKDYAPIWATEHMVPEGAPVPTEAVTEWPQPNEHGVYSSEDALVLEYQGLKSDKIEAQIKVLQIGPDRWSYGYNFSSKQGSGASQGSGIGAPDVFPTQREAEIAGLRRAKRYGQSNERDTGGSVSTPKQRASSRKVKEWAMAQLSARGAQADIEDVLFRSTEHQEGFKRMDRMKLTAEFEGEKITQSASRWVHDIDQRLKKLEELRTCG